jgi:hypothetical protein
MSARLEKLLAAVNVAFRYADDDGRAERILSGALRTLVNPDLPAPEQPAARIERVVDALGAPLRPRRPEPRWDELRVAVRAIAAEIGWPEAARRFGSNQETLKNLVYRRSRQPGVGRQARLLRLVASNGVTRH